YVAELYTDAKDADGEKNPMAYKISRYLVNGKTRLKLQLAKGGGSAVSIMPAGEEDMKKFKKY
ncbi:MAG: glycoside hydrolase family 97 C-terminal domain-containing protein, partial [Bacteroidota bacterium]